MNLLEALRAGAAQAAAARSKTFALPSVMAGGPRLFAVARPIGYVRFRELQSGAELGFQQELDAATDLLAEVTAGLLVEVDGERLDLGDFLVSLGAPDPGEPGPTQFDHRLAQMLGIGATSRREVVAHVVPDEMARIGVSNRMIDWLANVAAETAEEALGE